MFGRRITLVLGCLLGLTLPACGSAGSISAPEEAEPGVLTVTLTTPNRDDRAVLVSVTGPGEIGEVSAALPGEYAVHARSNGSSVRAAVFGSISSGPVLRISVPDVNRLSSYTATVQEVVDPSNNVRPSKSGYTLTISR